MMVNANERIVRLEIVIGEVDGDDTIMERLNGLRAMIETIEARFNSELARVAGGMGSLAVQIEAMT